MRLSSSDPRNACWAGDQSVVVNVKNGETEGFPVGEETKLDRRMGNDHFDSGYEYYCSPF